MSQSDICYLGKYILSSSESCHAMTFTYGVLFFFFGLVLLAALTGMMFRPGVWYASLNKPAWTPPNWMFPVVWTVLYVMIAIAGWLVWSAVGFGPLLWLWFAQLVLNMAWSWIFFGRKNMALGFVDILLLMMLIIAFIIISAIVVPLASLLFMPYLAWVMLAAALNFTIWRLNTG